MHKVITFQDNFLEYPGSIDLLRSIKIHASSKGDEIQIAMNTLTIKPEVIDLGKIGVVDFIMTPESFQRAAMAVGMADYFYLPDKHKIAEKNKGNPDWELLAEAVGLMRLPSDENSLHRLHDNFRRWQKAEERHDAAYFSPLFFMMTDDAYGMAVNYDWGNYKRYESINRPIFMQEPIHLRGNRELAQDEGFAVIYYTSTEIIEILENANTGKTKQIVLQELGGLIDNWDGGPIYYDIGARWGIYAEGNLLFQQAETWLRGEQGVSWRRSKEK